MQIAVHFHGSQGERYNSRTPRGMRGVMIVTPTVYVLYDDAKANSRPLSLSLSLCMNINIII